MSELKFSDLNLLPEMLRAIDELGFDQPTDIQAEAIPRIREGRDIIGRSQTGTGKTFAFAIPAIERIDRDAAETEVQVLILCPTRELAQQGCDEIRKLTRFMTGVWVADVYGGAPMDKQIARLKRCNLVIGTPGRVMDHMRRGTLNLGALKLVVLDEADEMLSMGFREDIETILKDVPPERQTVLFSATMPAPILELTETYLREPHIIEINREQVTLENIRQQYVDVPMGRKLDALNLILRAYEPKRSMIFCNTKLMVEEVAQYLSRNGFGVEALHGDLNQSQRSRVMDAFKSARIPLLVCTDVAARGIDVSDIDYVINYDVPGHDEYYVHRIGRTGRAGREGTALTLISGRRQYYQIRDLARMAKSEILPVPIPKAADIRARQTEKQREGLLEIIAAGVDARYSEMARAMADGGCDPILIAAAALQSAFAGAELSLQDIEFERRSAGGALYRKLILGVGRRDGVAPNHLVSAIASAANIPGREIGKIEIYDDRSVVGVPAQRAEEIVRALLDIRINGHPASVRLSPERPEASPRPGMRKGASDRRRGGKPGFADMGARTEARRAGRKAQFAGADADMGARTEKRGAEFEAPEGAPAKRGKLRLSESARARLLDASDLSRFEIRKPRSDARRDGRKPAGPRKEREKRGNRKNSDRGAIRRERKR